MAVVFFFNSNASRYLVMNMLGMCSVCDKIPPAHWDPITPTCTLRPHYSYLHTETPLLLPAHWDPITPTCTLGPHYSYLHTGTPLLLPAHWDPITLPAHWDPITPTCTLGPHHSYLHTGTPSLLPAHWDPTIQLPVQWQNWFNNITTLFITS